MMSSQTDSVRIVALSDLASSPVASLFEGRDHASSVSFFVTEHPPGAGPPLHRHPYDETFLIEAGRAIFTVDEEKHEARAGEVVVVPAHAAHGFVNAGESSLQLVAIHPCDHVRTGAPGATIATPRAG